MEPDVVKTVGQIAGIGGIAIGIILLLYKEFLSNANLKKMDATQTFKTTKLFLWLTWTIAILGLASWMFLEMKKPTTSTSPVQGIPETKKEAVSPNSKSGNLPSGTTGIKDTKRKESIKEPAKFQNSVQNNGTWNGHNIQGEKIDVKTEYNPPKETKN